MYIVNRKLLDRVCLFCLLSLSAGSLFAQKPLSWQEVKDEFESGNPVLQAVRTGIDESRAQEITAYLRPNPEVTGTIDQINPFTTNPPTSGVGANSYSPFSFALPLGSISYLHERGGKRALRRDSARQATGIAQSDLADQERNLLFTLRGAFIQSLHAKAVLKLAQDNLDYYDHVLQVNRERRQAGDISQVDLDRLELQRIQYESDVQTAVVNLRTAKIQLLMLLNSRTPVEQFDVTGPFEASERIMSLEEFQQAAVDTRPDLKAAAQSIEKAKTDHQLAIANGTADPTFALDAGRNPPIPAYIGFSVSVPLRIFDRNQGEKERTALEIQRDERLRDADVAQVFSDVDSAYAALSSSLVLVERYKAQYLQQSQSVRDTMSFAYQNGGASLLDFLSAQSDYRSTQLNYLNLVGSYLTAANQMNLAVGKEVLP